MATALTQAVADAYQRWRTNPQAPIPGVPYTGTVSELQAGDFLYGNRSVVASTGATTGTAPNQFRALTVERLGATGPVSWRTTDTVNFER